MKKKYDNRKREIERQWRKRNREIGIEISEYYRIIERERQRIVEIEIKIK